VRAVQDTGATVAFDAVGEGTLASELIYAMEQAAASRLIFHSPFGSFERKRERLDHADDTGAHRLRQGNRVAPARDNATENNVREPL
jgi:hypothetical protein